MALKNNKVVVVLPAYNAERTLEPIYKQIPKNLIYKVILVDDGSKDRTVVISRKLGIKTLIHSKNLGYGANQKNCYKLALSMKPDFVIMLHPDGQYNPKDLHLFVQALRSNKGDLILGSRFLAKGDTQTPFYKAISIKIITFLFNLILSINITEANSGYRGYTRKLLETIPFQNNGNGYIFDPQFIIQAVYFGFSIHDVPVTKQYNPEAISPNFKKSIIHGIENISLLIQYLLHKWGIRKAGFLSTGNQ